MVSGEIWTTELWSFATFRTPVAIQGIIVAILEVENRAPFWDANVDMEYVGVEGYTYD